MRAHLIKDGIIINTVEVENLDVIPGLVAPVGEEKIGWSFDGSTFTPPPPVVETDEQRRARLKADRTLAVEQITVTTTAGNVFDGDETSQTRMEKAASSLRYLTAKLAAGTPIALPPETTAIYRVVEGIYQMVWVLADNTPTFVTADELEEAKILAGAAQAAIWVIE